MSYRIEQSATVTRAIRSWGLSDTMLVEVYLRLNAIDPSRLVRANDPFDGMVFEFSMVDPENRLCEHVFAFQVVFSQDEQALIVVKGGHARQIGL